MVQKIFMSHNDRACPSFFGFAFGKPTMNKGGDKGRKCLGFEIYSFNRKFCQHFE